MSRLTARIALDALNNRPSYLEDTYAQADGGDLSTGVLSALRQLATAVPTQEIASWEDRKAQIVTDYGLPSGPADKPFAFSNGVAIIPVHGVLLNRFAYSWGFVTGYNFIRAQLLAALADDDVRLIAYDVNSPGGMAAGCEELSQEIYDSREVKPSVAIIDFTCYSAAMFVASGATRMVASPSSGIGSIGALAMRLDVTSALEQAGVKITVIFAGANKLDHNPVIPFSKDAKARLQASVDACYDKFVAAVVRNRDLSDAVVRGTEASLYDAEAALEMGLIDAIQSPNAAIEAAIEDLLQPDDDQEDTEMTTKPAETTTQAAVPDAAALATAATTASTAERDRIKAITTCEEATGRTALANHLAFNTTMSADEAKGMLAVAEKKADPVVAQTTTETTTTEQTNNRQSGFHQAMDETRNPNVTGDGGKPADLNAQQGGGSKTAQLLAAHAAATGAKYDTKH